MSLYSPTVKSMRKYLHHVILGTVLVLGAYYVATHQDELVRIREIRPVVLLPLVGLRLVWLLLNGLIFKVLVKALGPDLNLLEYFGLTVTSNFANYLAPGRLGMVIKGVYLKEKLKLPYSRYTSCFFAQTLLLLLTSGFCGLIGTWVISARIAQKAGQLCLFFAGILLATGVPLAYAPRMTDSNNRFLRIVRSFADGWSIIRSDHATILTIIVINMTRFVIGAINIRLMYAAFDLSVSFWPAFMIGVLGSLSNLISLTPANLGILETLFAIASDLLGFGFANGILAAGLNRIIQVVVVFSLAPIFSHLLTKRAIVHR